MNIFTKLSIALTTVSFFYFVYFYIIPKITKNKISPNDKIIAFISWLFSSIIVSIIVIIQHYINDNNLIIKISIQTIVFSIIPTFNVILKPYFLSLIYKKERDLILEKEISFIDNKIRVYNSKITNAFALGVSGFGKVIVIGEQLKKELNEIQLKGILYHEYGHHKFKHIHKIYLYTFIVSFATSTVLILTQHYFRDYIPMSIITMSNGFLYGVMIYYSLGFQKKMEYEADNYATKMIGKNEYLSTLKALNKIKNGSLEKKSATHPTLVERIKYINEKNIV